MSEPQAVDSPAASQAFGNPSQDIAFLKTPDGELWVGYGPFKAVSEAPSEAAFYVNDFELKDPAPWKIPARLERFSRWKEWPGLGGELPQITWKPLEPEWFEMVFRRIRKEVVARRLRKMVPVLTEIGTRLNGEMDSLVGRVLDTPSSLWAYGRLNGNEGFLGATPELLIKVSGLRLETMALAGTASPVHAGGFVSDAKEIEEHELVAGFLEEVLGELGAVERLHREVSDAAGLTHFRTTFTVQLSEPPSVDELIGKLHPTPAVGCLPRDRDNLAKLMEYRRQLHAPDFFGAPFGLKVDDVFYGVVAIRGLGWKGDDVYMPSGCGIVGGSVFDHEWRELRLKRDTVARMLSV